MPEGPPPTGTNVATGSNAQQLLQVGTSGAIHVHQPAKATWAGTVPRTLPGGIELVGRTNLLASMDEAMAATGARSCQLWGLPGSGKTSLALAWAISRIENYPDGQLFIDMRAFSNGPRVHPLDALGELLIKLGVPRQDFPEHTDHWGALFRAATAGRKCLVVLDNVASYADIEDLIPGHESSLIVTSRRVIPELNVRHRTSLLKLPLLTIDEGAELIAQRIGYARAEEHAATCREISALLDGHPLALALVGAKLATHETWSPEYVLLELSRDKRPLRFLDNSDLGIEVGRVISWSIDNLDDGAKQMLMILSGMPSQTWDVGIVSDISGLAPHECARVLRALSEAALIDEVAVDRFTMHELIRSYLSEAVGPSHDAGELDDVKRRTLYAYLAQAYICDRAIDPNRHSIDISPRLASLIVDKEVSLHQALEWFDSILPHMETLLDAGVELQEYEFVTAFAWSMNTYLYWRGETKRTLALHRAAVAAATDTRSGMLSDCRRALGRALADVGSHDLARQELMESLRLDEASGDLHGIASCRHAMAELALRTDEYRTAVRWGVLAVRSARQNANPVREARGLYDTARALVELGHSDWANEIGLTSLGICERAKDPYGVALALRLLGFVALKQERPREATHWLERASKAEAALGNRQSLRVILIQLELSYSAIHDEQSARLVRAELERVERSLAEVWVDESREVGK